ncbi:methyltransferase family protein [Mesorhizobium xinjiangense]|uniref:methyltransferase family protein n=1 Tax=Mesorhizobium xinjiangense TaxID=2678685 RepID=UPI0012EE4E93|nr:isoprenylcysteine carboxylmethyltransferase family protein [Mesorhizobium xinjiangense]
MATTTTTETRPVDQHLRIRALWIGAALIAGSMFFTTSAWSETNGAHEAVEIAGLGLVFVCLLGRLWSILYIGSRKNMELATSGPYSVTRNPLYLFSTIGAAGVGMMFGSLVMAAILAFLTYWLFVATAAREEAFLRGKFGSAYDNYAARTPLFWPDFRLYRDEVEVTFSPLALKRTLVDGIYFIALFPLLELIENLHTNSYLPSLLHLY